MFAVAAVLRALSHLQAMVRNLIRVTATRTAGAAVVDSQFDLAQRTLSLNHGSDNALGLGRQCLVNWPPVQDAPPR